MGSSLLLFKSLYVKAALLGVVPFRFHLYPASLELRTSLLYYCYLVSVAGPITRFLINVSCSLDLTQDFSVLRVTSVIMECCESVLLMLPVCFFLSRSVKVCGLFENLKQLHYSSILTGRVQMKSCVRKCFGSCFLYEIAYAMIILMYGLMSNDMPPILLIPYIPTVVMTTFSRMTLMMIMYGSGQYFLIIIQTINEMLLPNRQTATEWTHLGLMNLYQKLWKCSHYFNVLFGFPLVCYILLVFLHTTTVFYVLLSIFVLGKKDFTVTEGLLALAEIVWVFYDVFYVMLIIGTCSLVQDEFFVLLEPD
ncbi:AGAP009256-PE-like protein [Anopheles sinensis]|uniref:Gustatory receptor n=1 Tax=Anopheles sinensis TaxID=74873 RepID=A0A084WH16_ANOSI|nr:AGAP009256-PE-like protein [Anopheles sinensis]